MEFFYYCPACAVIVFAPMVAVMAYLTALIVWHHLTKKF